MSLVKWLLWVVAAVWIVLVLFGAIEFQELYGGTSGLQALLLGVAIGLVPAGIGWWLHRRADG